MSAKAEPGRVYWADDSCLIMKPKVYVGRWTWLAGETTFPSTVKPKLFHRLMWRWFFGVNWTDIDEAKK